jgi:hypothetical protein
MNQDNVNKSGKIIVGGKNPSFRDKLKSRIKEIIKKHMDEVSTSAAVGGGAGSAGPIKTPNAFGKSKDPTTGLDGYTQVGKSNTGTISEKDSKDKEKPKEKSKSSEKQPSSYEPIVKPATKAQQDIGDNEGRLKKIKDLETGLTAAQKILSQWRKTRETAKKSDTKSDSKK